MAAPMAKGDSTSTWVRWVIGILAGVILGLGAYVGTALATVDYHDKDVAQRERSQEKLEDERRRYLDGKFENLERTIRGDP